MSKSRKRVKEFADYLPKIKGGGGDYFKGRCADNHKPLALKDSIVIYGGAASDPIHQGLDIYVSLDRYSSFKPVGKYPWHEKYKLQEHVLFPIPDMSVPSDAEEFKRMIAWLWDSLSKGKTVHVGCLSGHGRTGLTLSALVKHATGNENAITYVRENYCHKVVESQSQVDWLEKHFGIKPVKPSKGHRDFRGDDYITPLAGTNTGSGSHAARFNSMYARSEASGHGLSSTVKPVRTAGNIWGLEKAFDELENVI